MLVHRTIITPSRAHRPTPLQEWDGGGIQTNSGIHSGRGFQAQVDVGAWIPGQTIVLDFGAQNKVRSLHAVYLV